jgi:hypothetical protein
VKESERLKAYPNAITGRFKDVLSGMRLDDITLIVRSDQLLCKLGERLTYKHGSEDSKFVHIRSKMRELAKLLKQMRILNPAKHAMKDFLCPAQFSTIIQASQHICGYNPDDLSYSNPSLVLKLSRNISHCAEILKSDAMELENEDLCQKSSRVIELIKLRWPLEMATNARRTIEEKNKSKVSLIPLTEDVKKLSCYLKESISNYVQKLTEYPDDLQVYSALQRVTLALLILFNRKRSGEVSRTTLLDYERKVHGSDAIGEDHLGLSKMETALVGSLYRMEITGKQSRIVPILMTEKLKNAVDILLEF